VVTVKGVSSEYVHLRVEPSERKGWQEAAERSGRSLSAMIRDALEVELTGRDHGDADGGVASSAAQQAHSARAKTLEEKIQAIEKLVDGLGS
jgi:hypothetical protein